MQSQFSPAIGNGQSTQFPVLDNDRQKIAWIAVIVLTILVLLSYLNTLVNVASYWVSPQYQHGFVVPIFAIILLYLWRQPFRDVPSWHRWIGVGLLAFGMILRVVGAQTVTFALDNVSLIPCVLGIFVMVGGLPTITWAGPSAAFLVFMYPLPRFLEENLLHRLQSVATSLSVFALQTLGIDAYRSGNQIEMGEMTMGVVEQCAGLRMLTIFSALAVGVALLSTTRPWWERVLTAMSAVPIALAVNVIRITLTGVMYNLNVSDEIANLFFHNAAGWIMMPLALGLLFLETQILSKIVIDDSALVTSMDPGLTSKAAGTQS